MRGTDQFSYSILSSVAIHEVRSACLSVCCGLHLHCRSDFVAPSLSLQRSWTRLSDSLAFEALATVKGDSYLSLETMAWPCTSGPSWPVCRRKSPGRTEAALHLASGAGEILCSIFCLPGRPCHACFWPLQQHPDTASLLTCQIIGDWSMRV